MSPRNFWALTLLLLMFASTAHADSVTLTIKAWAYSTSSDTGSTNLTLVATDSSGKEVALAVTFPDFTFVGVPANSYATSAVGASPLEALSAIAVSSRGTTNSVFNLAATQPLPTGTTTNVSIGFTGGLQSQSLSLSLNFTLTPGIGTYTVNAGGGRTLTLTGTGGTLTINTAGNQPPVAVPEPATVLLLGLGLALLKGRRRPDSRY